MRIRRVAPLVASLVFSLAAAAPSAEQPASQEPLDIGSRLELFVDDYLIESTSRVELKLHSPQPAERVLSFNREWEGGNSGYVTVFQDSGRYRMYYRGASSTGYIVPSLSKPGEAVIPEHPQVACYAESLDGITWKRPSLGLYEFNGSKDNNIVWTGSGGHNFSPSETSILPHRLPSAIKPWAVAGLGANQCCWGMSPLMVSNGSNSERNRCSPTVNSIL